MSPCLCGFKRVLLFVSLLEGELQGGNEDTVYGWSTRHKEVRVSTRFGPGFHRGRPDAWVDPCCRGTPLLPKVSPRSFATDLPEEPKPESSKRCWPLERLRSQWVTCWYLRCRRLWLWCGAARAPAPRRASASTDCAARWCSWRHSATEGASSAVWALVQLLHRRWCHWQIHSHHFPGCHSCLPWSFLMGGGSKKQVRKSTKLHFSCVLYLNVKTVSHRTSTWLSRVSWRFQG